MDAVSLFSGCGGSDLGLKSAGFDVAFASDISLAAATTYQANLPDVEFHVGDVSEIRSFPEAQLLVGCYPCQGFSQGGVRDSSRSINYLYREFDRALRLVRPKAFVVENVPGMTLSSFSHLLRNQVIRFRSAGYAVNWQVLNAADYGVAQERRRLFIVGLRSDLGLRYDFPMPTHGPATKRPYRTQRDAISDLPAWPEGEFCDDPFHWYYLSRDRYRSWDEPSKTVVSHARSAPLHPASSPLVRVGPDEWRFRSRKRSRRLSYREAMRLQGFPKGFRVPDQLSLRQRFVVIGNAVPPPLFAAVARALPEIWD